MLFVTTGHFSLFVCQRCSGPGPCPWPALVQIQSITDESRSSIRRKTPGAAQSSTRSRQSSTAEDTQEDEVADVVTPLSLTVRRTNLSSQSWISGCSSLSFYYQRGLKSGL